MKKYILKIVPLFLILLTQTVDAQVQLHDNAKVSLLTASPWHDVVYGLFGHTAIRVQDDSVGVDAIYNYGYFDSSQPDFMYNFIRGKTDYVLGVTTFDEFMFEYGFKGQQVYEQTLNLTPHEKQQLFNALYINSLPENMRYRYNYFYDNCATRPRDMIEEYVNGTIVYQPTSKTQSFRDLLHECTVEHKWTKFGIDLMVGSPSDRVIDVREKMFIPNYLMGSFEGATMVVNDTLSYPLVLESEVVLELNSELNNPGEQSIFTPFVTAFALLLLSIIVSLLQMANLNKVRPAKAYDTLLFGVAGIGGLVLFTLIFFSEHPATSPNWNFAWLNIFALVAAVLFWVKSATRIVYFYHFINFAVITLFVLLWWLIPQELPIATIPFSLSLLVRSGTNIYTKRNKKIKNSHFTSSKHMKAGWGQ
ncbi:MAG TPA: DUF4105 domain-containing protein [Bacteroidales bacterium]|nr:DUF4105 domain-containing protein [Bacteroidales bacterium]